MTTGRRNRLEAICDELTKLADEIGELSEALLPADGLLAIAEAHQVSAAALRVRVLRGHVPDIDD